MNQITGKRYHVQAWGSDVYPDIDEMMDTVPDGLAMKYKFVFIALKQAVSYKDVMAALDERPTRPRQERWSNENR